MGKSLWFALIIVAFILGAGFGYFLTPEYRMGENAMAGFGRADRTVDLRYINAMAAHHRGAMLLAEQVKDQSRRPEIQALASEILANEPKLISELYAWKRQWYGDSRKAKDPAVANLGAYDETLDLRFLNALLAHHQDGIAMAKEIRGKTSRAEVLNNADTVEQFLQRTSTSFKQWRSEWYGIN